MKKQKIKNKIVGQKEKVEYQVRLVTERGEYKSSGETLLGALSLLNPSVNNVKNILYVKNLKTGNEKYKILSKQSCIRLFNTYGIVKDIALKNLDLMFKGI